MWPTSSNVLLSLRAVEAQHPQALVQLRVAGGDGAAVAEAGQVLGREERERGQRAERAGAAGVGERAGRLRGVLDHRHAERGDLGTGATLPNRCTASTAACAGVSAARTVSAVTQYVSGSTSQNTGRAPALTIASAEA